MTPITKEIRDEIERAGDMPVCLEDAQTGRTYVLLRADLYEHIQRLLAEEDRHSAEAAFAGIQEVLDDWNDPAMDIYNRLDPRR